jgi:hypothetical protein
MGEVDGPLPPEVLGRQGRKEEAKASSGADGVGSASPRWLHAVGRNFPSKHRFTRVKKISGIIVHRKLQMEVIYRCKKNHKAAKQALKST